MKDWNKTRLKEVAEIQTGPFGSQLHKSDYIESGTPIITVEHLGDNRIIHVDTPFISDEDKDRLDKYSLEEDDIVFSRVGSVDRRAIVRSDENGWLFSGRCLRVRFNSEKVSPKYVSYYFGLESFKQYIRGIAVGATMPSLNTKILSDIEIPLPPLPTQRKIADILSALDDKIENNRKVCEKLEEIAAAVFRRWFVDKADDSWEQIKLGDIITLNYGKALTTECRVEGEVPVYSSAGITGYHNQSLCQEEGIIIGRKGTIGKIYHERKPFFCIDTAYYTSQKDMKEPLLYILYLIKGLGFEDMNEDSAVPGLNRNRVYDKDIKKPPKEIITKFDDFVSPVINKKSKLEDENAVLKQTRDTLLPKLISGELPTP